ncbi:DnaJ C-terminal domain-containing protein [Saxibacter everestensis]|uniref:DnaJ C-terminal domain-containing protein n=1 Tax=Saxibacter everestensis TaxID=2909229 RepID=A0ABY8QT99_9MICO|nr:DnaJ C-terminal domain-containing protein [Brevibacteriaceae bacterium ZFBP1038]
MNTGPQNAWFDKDYYATLGVSKDASADEVKKSYRKLARKYHPDANPGDSTAEAKFKELGEAYAVLSDKEERAQYDSVRAMASGTRFSAGSGGARAGAGGGAGFEDLFGGLFQPETGSRTSNRGDIPPEFADLFDIGGYGSGGRTAGFSTGPRKGGDISARTTLNFTEAIEGATVKLNGASSGPISVRTPIGVKDGQKIRLRGKGQPSPNGGEPGDMLLTVNVEQHPVFKRDGDNLRIEVPVTFDEAALGAEIQVPVLNGLPVRVKVAPGTPSGRVLRVRGRGVKTKSHTGDLLVTVEVVVPKNLSADAQKAVKDFQTATKDEDPRVDLIQRAKSS